MGPVQVVIKKTSVLLIFLLVLAAMLSACSSDDGQSGNEAKGIDSVKENEDGQTAPFRNGKFDPPVTMTSIGCTMQLNYKNGETFDNNVALRWAKEKLGIEVKYIWQAPHDNGGCEQKLRLTLSGNRGMPDVLHVWANSVENKNLLANLIDSGQFMDIGEAFDKYASDDLKRIMNENPEAWYMVTKDNKKYGIPIFQLAHNNDNILYIREDWLKKLNLEPPKTIDELEKVMDAFVNKDPDGNNKKDTLGLAVTLETFNSWLADASWLFGAYGASPNVWKKAGDGLVYGSVQPEMKLALGKLREWMEKGYIDKEALLHNIDKANSLVTSGKAGILPAPLWGSQWPLADAVKNVPGASFKAIGIPTGPDGKTGHYTLGLAEHAFLINKNFKHPDAAFLYFNKLLEFTLAKPGSDMENGMMEGYDYAIVDGKVTKATDRIPGGQFDVYKATLIPEPPNDPKRNINSFTRLSQLKEGEMPTNQIDKGNYDCCKTMIKDAKLAFSYIDSAYRDIFTGAPTETMRSKGDFLVKMEKETFAKIIYGQLPLDEFDKFVEKWKSSGGSQITKEVNAWYKSVKGN